MKNQTFLRPMVGLVGGKLQHLAYLAHPTLISLVSLEDNTSKKTTHPGVTWGWVVGF